MPFSLHGCQHGWAVLTTRDFILIVVILLLIFDDYRWVALLDVRHTSKISKCCLHFRQILIIAFLLMLVWCE